MNTKPSSRSGTWTLEELIAGARQLSAIDQVRLIEQVAPGLEQKLPTSGPSSLLPDQALALAYLAKAMSALVTTTSTRPKRSFYGLCADLGKAPSAEEIDALTTSLAPD